MVVDSSLGMRSPLEMFLRTRLDPRPFWNAKSEPVNFFFRKNVGTAYDGSITMDVGIEKRTEKIYHTLSWLDEHLLKWHWTLVPYHGFNGEESVKSIINKSPLDIKLLHVHLCIRLYSLADATLFRLSMDDVHPTSSKEFTFLASGQLIL